MQNTAIAIVSVLLAAGLALVSAELTRLVPEGALPAGVGLVGVSVMGFLVLLLHKPGPSKSSQPRGGISVEKAETVYLAGNRYRRHLFSGKDVKKITAKRNEDIGE